MARKPGRVGVLKIQTDGVAGVAGWDTVEVKRDLSIAVDDQEIDLSASEAFDVFEQGPTKLVITGTLVKDPADTEWAALQAAKAARTIMGFWALDVDGGEGWQFDGKVFTFTDTANRSDGQLTSITIMPAAGGAQPSWESDA